VQYSSFTCCRSCSYFMLVHPRSFVIDGWCKGAGVDTLAGSCIPVRYARRTSIANESSVPVDLDASCPQRSSSFQLVTLPKESWQSRRVSKSITSSNQSLERTPVLDNPTLPRWTEVLEPASGAPVTPLNFTAACAGPAKLD